LAENLIREFVDREVDPPIVGFLHLPVAPGGNAIVLSHGAGSNARAPLLVGLADKLCAAGFIVLRCDLPFRQVRPWGPPGRGDAARDREGLKNAVAALMKILAQEGRAGAAGKIFLGGHSYGGRQASMLAAEEPDLAAGLLLLSYPLHPPDKPQQQRTQHLPDLRTPALFVHGMRDGFGTIGELEQALKMIPAKTKLLTVEGAGHDLGFKGKARKEELLGRVVGEFAAFFGVVLSS